MPRCVFASHDSSRSPHDTRFARPPEVRFFAIHAASSSSNRAFRRSSPRDARARAAPARRARRSTRRVARPDRATARDARATATTTRVGRGSARDADDDAQTREDDASDGGRASDGVSDCGKRASALTAAIKARAAKAKARATTTTNGDGDGGRRVGVGTRAGRVEERSGPGIYGSSSHGGHGREMMYDRRRGADVRATTRKRGGSERADDGGGADDSRGGRSRCTRGIRARATCEAQDGELYEMLGVWERRGRARTRRRRRGRW